MIALKAGRYLFQMKSDKRFQIQREEKMNKLSRSDFKIEIFLFTIVVIFGVLTLIGDFINIAIPFLITWLNYLIVTVAFWRVIQKIVRVKKDKIPGKTFEFFFFFFLFISSYSITFLVSFYDKPEKILDSFYMNLLFMPSLISAAYSGWLYYIEGITSKKYWKPKKKRKIEGGNNDRTDKL